MPAFSLALAEWFHDHHGIASSADLRNLGVSDDQRRLLLERGILEPLFEGVYRLVAVPLSFESRGAAVCAADPSFVLSCHTSGSLLGLRRCGDPFIHAGTERRAKPIGHGVRIHRTWSLPPEDVVVRPDGIRLTTAARLYFDMAKHVSDLTLTSIVEQIIQRELATFESLAEVTKRLAVRGRPGSARAIRVLGSRPADGAAADSHDEVVLLRSLHDRGLTGFVRHPAVTLLDGSVVHPDLGDPRIGFYIEVDHHTWHDPTEAVDYDKDRDRRIRLLGATVERVTDTHLRTNLDGVLAQLTTLYRTRLRNFGAGTGQRPGSAPKLVG
jgi:hypothetical protein